MGAPRKSPDGLDKVLYVRSDAALLAALDREGKKRSPKGAKMSRSDIARALLWEALTPKDAAPAT
jgi:hypothetical protein